MAKQQGGSQSRGQSRGAESTTGRNASARSASTRNAPTRNASQNTSTGSSARAGGSTPKQSNAGSTTASSGPQRTTTDQRADQERTLNVSREGSNTAATDAGVKSSTGGSTASTAGAPGATAATSASTGPQNTSAGKAQPGRAAGTNVAGRSDESILPALMANPWLMTNAFLANPYGFARAMNQEMDRLFSNAPADVSPYSQRATSGSSDSRSLDVSRPSRGMTQWSPQVEVRHSGNQLTVCADLPGLSAKDIDIQIDDGILTISGERQQSSEDKQEGYYRSERSYGSFSRSIALPDGVNEDQIRARFDNGVLEVTVPMATQRQRGRRVEIQSGG